MPIGLLTNRETIRLIYAPHGQSSGSIDFRIADMLRPDGAPILDACLMLLRADRWYSVADAHTLPGLLAASRTRQANVTNQLADQVFTALNDLLTGFDRANQRDPQRLLDAALQHGDVYGGLLTVLLRLVFLLYAEEHALLPVEHPLYQQHLSVLALYQQLTDDAGLHPDEMDQRFGAWPRLLATFRALYLGAHWQPPAQDGAQTTAQALNMPARSGDLFNPDRYPWLEGRPAGATSALTNGSIHTPALDDGTVLKLLHGLIVVEGQRLSYRALDVEQIGSVYERLMGYSVERLPAPAVCLRPSRVWITGDEIIAIAPNRRSAHLHAEIGLARALSNKLAKALKATTSAPDALTVLAAHAGLKKAPRAQTGQLILQPGSERRRTSSHYTPRSLSAPIVARTLEPLLRCLGPTPQAAQILQLKVCDPAMGSGAFLVEACRHLADHLVAAWTRDGTAETLAHTVPDLATHARRLVAQRCLYGVDKNPFAVELARMSLWLVTLACDLPFTFVDHALRHGDSLVGLSLDQVGGFHWAPTQQVSLFTETIRETLDDTVEIRQKILDLAESPDTAQKARLLDDATYFTHRARTIADACIGAFFDQPKKAARERERKRRLTLVEAWLNDEDAEAEAEIRQLAAKLRAEVTPFHWMLEFPEVFYAQRPDPLADGEVGVAWMDAFVGNPPFMGGGGVSGQFGDSYLAWLTTNNADSHGTADISAFFLRRATSLLGSHGSVGIIATNSITESETRRTGLQYLIRRGFSILAADSDMHWPGEAAVVISTVTLGCGACRGQARVILDGDVTTDINSRLQPFPERDDPVRLAEHVVRPSYGIDIAGNGFLLSCAEAELFEDNINKCLSPYAGGSDLTSQPVLSPAKFVVDLQGLTLEEASLRYPRVIEHLRQTVLVERLRRRDNAINRRIQKYWWHWWADRPDFFAALRGKSRFLAWSIVAKHLALQFCPADIRLGKTAFCLADDRWATFAVLQSRLHEPWVRLLSSSLETRLRYSASACFDTFPFPADLTDPQLEATGEALYSARAAYMIEHNQGLTTTYNQLKDPSNRDPQIEHLRRLHEAMDRAVLAAYGWPVPVPPYGTADPAAQQAFDDDIIDRLFVLNAQRAAEEALQAPKPKARKAKPKAVPDDQMELI